MNPKQKAILSRIQSLDEAITKGHEYLQSGKHAAWSGFRPLFTEKVRGGERLPPHRDWVKNVFLPRQEIALKKAEVALERVRGYGR